jgi:hypothetical protein
MYEWCNTLDQALIQIMVSGRRGGFDVLKKGGGVITI